MKNFLKNRRIIDILIGDAPISNIGKEEEYLPYLSGGELVSLCNELGYSTFYSGQSRWVYMDELIEYLYDKNETSRLFERIFSLHHFEGHIDGANKSEIHSKHTEMVATALDKVNSILLFSEIEIRKVNTGFYLHSISDSLIIDKKIETYIDQNYITNLEERVQIDLLNDNYDSVLTKCRTIIEEVLIYIAEQLGEEKNSKGDIVNLFNHIKKLLNLQQRKEFDKRINQLLGGLENIIRAISSLRNISGDAHGKGSNRIRINKREAELVINSTITICLYLINIFEDQQDGKGDIKSE